MKKRPFLIIFITFFSTSSPAQQEETIAPELLHPYQRIAPQKVKSFFEIMNEDQIQEEQQMEEDPDLRSFEDQRTLNTKRSMKDR